MTDRCFRVAVLIAAAGCFAAPARADIIFERLGGGTGNNVLFQCPTGDTTCEDELSDGDEFLIGTIQNTTYQTLFEADVDIEAGAAGQATIVEVDPDATDWQTLDMSWINFDSTDLVILRIKPTTSGTTIELTACDTDGNCYSSAPDFTNISAPQGDFFRVRAINGQLIETVGVIASLGSLSEVEQVRLGDLHDGDDVIPGPEPAVMTLFGVGLFALAGRARRRR